MIRAEVPAAATRTFATMGRGGAAERLSAERIPFAERLPAGAPDAGEVARRIAAVVGEIDALKRERHATPVLDARAKLAEIYFRKRSRPATPRKSGGSA